MAPKRSNKRKVNKKQSAPETKAVPVADLPQLLEDLNSGKASLDAQEQCPLFGIPAEIRNDIFSYVFTEQDSAVAIKPTDYWYRPDYTHFRYIETALLRTCRRIFFETHSLPRQYITRRIWAGDSERRPDRFVYTENEATKAQLDQQYYRSRVILPCETVQVFIQMYALERGSDLSHILKQAQQNIATRHLTITLRYTDWWWWENNNPLRINSNWMKLVEFPNSLERLTMELETRQGKRPELDLLVAHQVSQWSFSTVNGKPLTLSPHSPKSKSYIGTSKPGKVYYQHHSAGQNHLPGAKPPAAGEMYYYVVTLDYVV